MKSLTTNSILAPRQCQKRLWLEANEPDASDLSRNIAQGVRLGEIAREVWGPGTLITLDAGVPQAVAATAQALATGNTIFEATFSAGNVITRLDILRPADNNNWDLVEVKSGSKVHDEYLDYMAIQAHLCRQAGVQLNRLYLAHVNADFVYSGDSNYDGLLAEEDVTGSVMTRLSDVPQWITRARHTLSSSKPAIEPGRFCKSPHPCGFQDRCWNESGIEYPVEILPHGWKLADRLRAQGYRDLRDVPLDSLEKEKHQRVQKVSQSGLDFHALWLKSRIQTLAFPRSYLDFETISYSVPRWAGTSPYQPLGFQWSLHTETPSGRLTHQEFLSTGDHDPRHAFLESLLDSVSPAGPIIVYSSYEEVCLRKLALALPHRANEIQALIDRLVDLLPWVRDGFYSATMKGSYSVKKVLPTLAPELSYTDLNGVANGEVAMEAFDRLITLPADSDEYRKLKTSMLAYCRLDTYAMVAVLHRLADPACLLPEDDDA